ncbi:hypothetical protein TGAM01_v200291 [Trichoderma gamsii]|uniref:Methyltransferase type 11 domain-containing protein n=1 Tax=Trichoderma gamsii TaxID=398673 RepID=A0A2K0TKR5_9HYPO|nr:hypothetical protein TGAM01_v200291 [Trichoderma gamsii]PNP46118.1 hypothetical protein TGAMA5MH_02153 [Trichoderma gamsii]PON30871.1 hypothetical protein TGAM01_v200291 [Trichoderma gamsii]
MTAEEDQALGRADYWDSRYSKSDGEAPTHEWFRAFSDLEPFFRKNLFGLQSFQAEDNPLILHLGSGDSVVPAELASRGYRRQLCIDFSPVVVELMTERHSKVEGIEWKHMDVRNMDISDKSIDVAFDKGTLDAMIHGSPWSPPSEVKDNTSKYMREVHRVLKDHGVFLYITFRQPHFIKPLLNPDDLWDMDMQVLGDGGSFDYYGFVIKKNPNSLEAVNKGI